MKGLIVGVSIITFAVGMLASQLFLPTQPEWLHEKTKWTNAKMRDYFDGMVSLKQVYAWNAYADLPEEDRIRETDFYMFKLLACGTTFEKPVDVMACYEAISKEFFEKHPPITRPQD